MSRVHLSDLVDRHKADSAEWHYIEDTKHVTKGVMHWVVILHHAIVENEFGGRRYVKNHVIELANGCELIVDEYVTRLVLKRMEVTNES